MDYKLIYKLSTVLEAIMLTINVISVCVTSPKFVYSWCSVDGSPVSLLPIENPFPMGTNNRRLLENAITLERKGILTIATFCELSIVWRII